MYLLIFLASMFWSQFRPKFVLDAAQAFACSAMTLSIVASQVTQGTFVIVTCSAKSELELGERLGGHICVQGMLLP